MSTPLPTPSEHGWPFSTGPGQVVSEHDWETMASTWQRPGVVGQPNDGLGLLANRFSENQIIIHPGVAHIGGHYYELKVSTVFDLDITGSGFDTEGVRRDVVTLRLDRGNATFRFVQIKGGIDLANGQLNLESVDEIPLVQVDVTSESGIVTDPIDRRWFVGRQVRPISGAVPGLDPVPYEGELGVDTTRNFLVVGKNGLWVPAAQVFNNDDSGGAVVTQLGERVTTVEGQVSTLQTNVSSVQTGLATAQSQVAGLTAGSWTNISSFSNGMSGVPGELLQVRKQGATVNLRGTVQKEGFYLDPFLNGSQVFFTVPPGFAPDTTIRATASAWDGARYVYLLIAVINSSGQVFLDAGTEGGHNTGRVYFNVTWMV